MIIGEPNNFNPLSVILDLFPTKEPILLTPSIIDKFQNSLYLANIICQSLEDSLKCLSILEDMKILSMAFKENNNLYIGNLYNGK